ncbi:MoxR family ATPase [Alicyclobacillus tolerans]|uniref:AAA family ATPase n=1 Tax=Alicyclobacillus tolerans TaxID=90970 RepID=UPI001F3526DB|nr:MoxR family ATPase [Alicyclobacillus tolerans]MCF8564333.1 MoxR family ATPase [Alicyclobacillus tolerans]
MSQTVREHTLHDWIDKLAQARYLADESLAAMVRLAVLLHRPLLLEGPAGVGKTALAQALAKSLQRELVRLQCYEGIESQQALYEWNYHKQLADLAQNSSVDVFSEDYLLARPLLRALQSRQGAVLLIDEVDRADEAFEAMLLEFLADHQVSVPEYKTVSAHLEPVVVLTSNRTRPLSDALRRRCLYYYVDWPTSALEQNVVALHVPELSEVQTKKLVYAVRLMRTWNLIKPPGLAETLDWSRAFAADTDAGFDERWALQTLGCVIKDAIDLKTVRERIRELFDDT